MTTAFRQYRCEMRKLWSRPRSYIGFAIFFLLQLLIYLAIQLKGDRGFRRMIEGQGAVFEDFFSATTLGFFVLVISTLLLGGIYLALVAGDIVSKEAEDGTLRLVLARPISRLRLLAIKYASAVTYNFLFVVAIGVMAWLLGGALRGFGGGFFALEPETRIFALHTGGDALFRYALCVVFLALSMITITSVAFFFSCTKVKPAAATILALSVMLGDLILARSPFMEEYTHLFLNTYTSTWVRSVVDPFPWAILLKNYAILMGINLTLFILGWSIFESRDFKS